MTRELNLKARILLVEDNHDDEELTRRAILKVDPTITIEVAKDGFETLEILRGIRDTGAPPHSLILADLKIPKVGGIEMIRQIREINFFQIVPIVALSSSDEVSDVRASYQAGANSYIRKELDYQKFQQLMERVIVYWLDCNLT